MHSSVSNIQRAIEDRMGDSLGDVRIHTGAQAAKACEDINARAFTVGNHIAFNAGEYDPSSPEGQHVLAHELAHVRQQTGGAVSMLPQDDVQLEIDPDPSLEREAEETAQQVMQGGELGIQRMAATEVHVQRLAISDDGTFMAYDVGPLDFGGSKSDGDDEGVAATPEALAEEVQAIKERQEQMMETLTTAKPGADTDGEWGKAATKGLAGSLAGAGAGAAVGAVAGSVLPGVGTAVGAAAGAAVSGTVGDVVKEGVEVAADNRDGADATELSKMYEEMARMYREMKEGTGHAEIEGKARSRQGR